MAPLVLQEPQALQVPPDQPAPPVLPALQEPQDQQGLQDQPVAAFALGLPPLLTPAKTPWSPTPVTIPREN